jgi:DNA-directed RNA polymerase subunit N (RpoN/RPB10)
MFYIRCKSCGRIISGRGKMNMEIYFTEKKKIDNNPNLSEKEKKEQAAELVKSMDTKLYCCTINILGAVPYHDIIR